MGNYLDPGNQLYAQIRSKPYFVDKTGLLRITNQELDGAKRFLCVSRPRRFGKTLAAEMLTSYYSCGCDSASLFEGLSISSSPDYLQHLNQYHVIHFSVLGLDGFLEQRQMKQHMGRTKSKIDWLSMDAMDFIDFIITKEIEESFPNCYDPDGSMMEILRDIHQNHESHPRFIIVIDEWDHIFRKYVGQTKLQEKYVSFLASLFKSDLTAACIPLAYLTGIYPIKKHGLQSSLNIFSEFTMINPSPLEEFTGFSESEVAALCSKVGLSLDDMKEWYDGYHINEGYSVYCPDSVIQAVTRKKITSYWPYTESFDDIKTYIDLDIIGLRPSIAELLKGDTLSCDTGRFSNNIVEPKTRDEILTMLVHLGYLTCVQTSDDTSMLAIPNREIKDQFISNTKDQPWLSVFKILDHSIYLLQDTWSGDSVKAARGIEQAHFALAAAQNYNTEEALRCVILTAYHAARAFYDLHVEANVGVGRADVFFEPLSLPETAPAIPILVELKWNKSADSAIQQIKNKQYARSLSKWADVLLVGINYDPDSRVHTCVIEHHYPNKP